MLNQAALIKLHERTYVVSTVYCAIENVPQGTHVSGFKGDFLRLQ
jgi:hypothetical protein